MKIITRISPPEPAMEKGDFNNGDLYINRIQYHRGNRSDILYCSCGMLIPIASGNVMHNIRQCGLERSSYVNVTSKFSLILNELYENQKETIARLVDEQGRGDES